MMIINLSFFDQEFWSMNSSIQLKLISLTEEIAGALASEFKLYLPQIIPHVLKIFMYDDSANKDVTKNVKIKF